MPAGNSPKLRGVYTVPAGNSPKLRAQYILPPVIVQLRTTVRPPVYSPPKLRTITGGSIYSRSLGLLATPPA